MILKQWEKIPKFMRNDEVFAYYKSLKKRKVSLFLKRVFDIIVSSILILFLLPLMLIIAFLIYLDSPGNVIYVQKRVTQFGRIFKLLKFRTMVVNADKIGSLLTVKDDKRVTKLGKILRKFRLDELPQIFNIFKGDLSFVGTRPEVLKYVEMYDEKMLATLLLPAGVTSLASIKFKDEEKFFEQSENIDETYRNVILPKKMQYNLDYLSNLTLALDVKIMLMTVFAVLKR